MALFDDFDKLTIKFSRSTGEPAKNALKTIKALRLAKCTHSELDVRPIKCLLSIVDHESNAEHFFIATQDVNLLKKLDSRAACPYVTIKLNALFLNKPTQASKDKAKKELEGALTTDYELNKLKEIKRLELGEEAEPKSGGKRKKVRGPHPLSCKKKQVKLDPADEPAGKKRRHKKNRISKHIRKLLKSNEPAASTDA